MVNTNVSKMIELYREGNSVRYISMAVGLCHKTVSKKLRKAGVGIDHSRHYNTLKPDVPDNLINEMAQKYEAGLSCSQLSREYGYNDGRIKRVIRKKGIRIRTSAEAVRLLNQRDQDDFFNKMGPDQWYLFGLFCADGSCDDRVLRCGLKFSDRRILREIRDHIGLGSLKARRTMRNDKTHFLARLTICSTPIINKLVELGIRKIKLNDPEPIRHLQDKDLVNFLAGYFDGDGIICKAYRRAGFCGPEKIMALFATWIGEHIGITPNVLSHGSIFRIQLNGDKSRKLLDWIYTANSRFRLRRKYDLYVKNYYSRIRWIHMNRFSVSKDVVVQRGMSLATPITGSIARCFVAPRYSNEELNKEFDRIKREDISLYFYNNKIRSIVPNGFGMPGRRIMTHFNPHFWQVPVRGRKTIPESWTFDNIKKCLEISIKEQESLSLERLFREMFFHLRCARTSLFAPGLARYVYDRFLDGDKVFDPCAGWGGRLIAAHVNGIKYEACEISPKTVKGLRETNDFIGFDAKIYERSCLLMDWPKSDLIFTSPPYYKNEFYIGGNQPHKWSHDDWLNKFVKVFLDRINTKCILYVNEQTLDEFCMFREPDDVLEVSNRKHPRRKFGYEYLAIYNSKI